MGMGVISMLPTGIHTCHTSVAYWCYFCHGNMYTCVAYRWTAEQAASTPAANEATCSVHSRLHRKLPDWRSRARRQQGQQRRGLKPSYRTGFKPWFEVLDWSGLDLIMCVVWWGSVLVEEKVEQAGMGFGRRPRGFDLVMVRIPDH